HIPLGEEIPVQTQAGDLEFAQDEILEIDESDDESARTVEFVINNKPETSLHDTEADIDDKSQLRDHEDFGHLKDLKKLNESSYLDNIENEPAYKRLNKNEDN
ncbi:MAG: hypothetical protein KBB11_05215, partial [Bacteroidales bacterium]|nr:hypothetical protein [Bacteroidales bacterium]